MLSLWGAALLGLAAALGAFYGRYRALPAALTGPAMCRLEDNGCQVLFRSRQASLVGVPNAALGVAFYVALMIGLSAGWPAGWLLAGATGALMMTVALAAILIRNRFECRVCWVGHAANLVVWILLVMRTLQGST
jgi:uncharacterized membrane protein